MPGFLDKNDTVVDMVLTSRGKQLLSRGKLQFVYYVLSDSEVDYDPFISDSGSLSGSSLEEEIERQIDATLVREPCACVTQEKGSLRSEFDLSAKLFDMPQGQRVVPTALTVPSSPASSSLEATQQHVIVRRTVRDQSGDLVEVLSEKNVGFSVVGDPTSDVLLRVDDYFPSLDGFDVCVFSSGSDGLTEISAKRDREGRISYGPDLIVLRDDETVDTETDEEILEILNARRKNLGD